MDSKEYFEKVMQDYNQNRKGRSLRKYCKDEAVDYDRLIQYKKSYYLQEKKQEQLQDAFIPITIKDDTSNVNACSDENKNMNIQDEIAALETENSIENASF